jgi:hypothetical protein
MDDDFKPCTAISWYSRAAWRELQSIPAAGLKMSYREFTRRVREVEEMLGGDCIRFDIDVKAMLQWCTRNGFDPDEKGMRR